MNVLSNARHVKVKDLGECEKSNSGRLVKKFHQCYESILSTMHGANDAADFPK